MNAHDQLLDLAEREGWIVVHDLGLYLEVFKPRRRVTLGFDQQGRYAWCNGAKMPMTAAMALLVT